MIRGSKEWLIKIAIKYYKAKLFKETIEACEKALALDLGYITPYYGIGKSLIGLHKYQEALGVYNKALAIKETKELYTQRGMLYSILKQYACASNDHYRALALDPDMKKYKYYEAVRVHDKAIEMKETKELYAQRGDLYYLLTDYVNASNDYYRALVLDPKDEELMKKKAKANEYVAHMDYPSWNEEYVWIEADQEYYPIIERDYKQGERDDLFELYGYIPISDDEE